MPLEFDSTYLDRHISQENSFSDFGIDPNDIIKLTGVLGLVDCPKIAGNCERIKNGDFELKELQVTNYGGVYPEITVWIKLDKPEIILKRRINVQSRRIYNVEFVCSEKQKGRGLRMLSSQTSYAGEMNFKWIDVSANGNFKAIETYNGYITWGKLGFQIGPASKNMFSSILAKANRTEKLIHELFESEDGSQFWIEFGQEWEGIFFLGDDSLSLTILENYRQRKEKENN